MLTYEIPYRNFNPKNTEQRPFGSYYVLRETTDVCIPEPDPATLLACKGGPGPSLISALAAVEEAAIYATGVTPITPRQDILLSSYLLTGIGRLSNLAVDGSAITLDPNGTRHASQTASYTPIDLGLYDLDRNGIPDFVKAHDGALYINFDGQPIQPDPQTGALTGHDIVRAGDFALDLAARGLLAAISPEDLQQTDLQSSTISACWRADS